jgi:pimeloyl-ACP methyl ester carboxylesterase
MRSNPDISAIDVSDGVLPPVLFVHGFASSFEHGWSSTGWVDVFSSEGRQVVGADLLGHGTADKYFDPAAYADVEDRFWKDSGAVGPVDGIGFSMGGLTLLRLASRHPERFRRLVILGVGDTALRTESPGARPVGSPDLLALVEQRGDASDPLTPVFTRLVNASRNDPAALSAFLRRPQQPLTRQDLHQITSPTLFILGDRDFAGPNSALVTAVARAESLVLPGVDHFSTPSSVRALGAALDFVNG